MLRQTELALAVLVRLLLLLEFFDFPGHVKLNLDHGDQALVVRARHQLEQPQFIDSRHWKRFTGLVDLPNHVLNLHDVSLRLSLLGKTQETLETPTLILHPVVVAIIADQFGVVAVVFLSLLVHFIEVKR